MLIVRVTPHIVIYRIVKGKTGKGHQTKRANKAMQMQGSMVHIIHVQFSQANIIIQCEPDFKEFPFHQQICYLK